MNLSKSPLIALCILCFLSFPGYAELKDQGLNSIMLIIDKAVDEVKAAAEERDGETEEQMKARLDAASATIVNLSRTLGTLSYSRLQCGEAGVLAEFTQRVQLMPDERRDAMRDAFQEGFDKSKDETALLSADECERLTRSRIRTETVDTANVVSDKKDTDDQGKAGTEEVEEVVEAEDPMFRHIRVAEMSGQLAFKRRFCQDEKVFNRDYNEYLESIPEEYREEVKSSYWKGYKHGERMNKNLTQAQC